MSVAYDSTKECRTNAPSAGPCRESEQLDTIRLFGCARISRHFWGSHRDVTCPFAAYGSGARFALVLGIGGVIGFYAPVFWLGRKIKARQKAILKQLPDAMDLLTISVESGLGFDAAMQKVAEKWDNELSRAFARVDFRNSRWQAAPRSTAGYGSPD